MKKPSRFWMLIARLWFGKELRDALMECGDVSTAKRFLAEVDKAQKGRIC